MSLPKLMQTQFPFAKVNLNFLAAARFIRPLLKSPIAQVLISFMVGYYATTKIAQLYGLIRKLTDKRYSKIDFATQGSSVAVKSQARKDLRLTSEQLTAYDGFGGNQPIYTALNGKIYDLSSSRDTLDKPGPYSLLAGCNANQVLNIACDFMGVSTEDLVDRWERSLNAEFNIIGYLVDSDTSESDDT